MPCQLKQRYDRPTLSATRRWQHCHHNNVETKGTRGTPGPPQRTDTRVDPIQPLLDLGLCRQVSPPHQLSIAELAEIRHDGARLHERQLGPAGLPLGGRVDGQRGDLAIGGDGREPIVLDVVKGDLVEGVGEAELLQGNRELLAYRHMHDQSPRRTASSTPISENSRQSSIALRAVSCVGVPDSGGGAHTAGVWSTGPTGRADQPPQPRTTHTPCPPTCTVWCAQGVGVNLGHPRRRHGRRLPPPTEGRGMAGGGAGHRTTGGTRREKRRARREGPRQQRPACGQAAHE